MKERGILFRDRLVRRILAGGKTQTRRIVKLPPDTVDVRIDPGGTDVFGQGPYIKAVRPSDGGPTVHPRIYCPYGYPGDRLWVREAWRSWTETHCDHHTENEPCDEHCRQVYVAYRSTPRTGYRPVPDRQTITYLHESTPIESNRNLLGPWKPGIHLRRDHARIDLDVVEVRVERLQDISEGDAVAEGIEVGVPLDVLVNGEPGKVAYFDARTAFAHLWCGVNGLESWKANPWVWVVEFKRVEAQAKEAA